MRREMETRTWEVAYHRQSPFVSLVQHHRLPRVETRRTSPRLASPRLTSECSPSCSAVDSPNLAGLGVEGVPVPRSRGWQQQEQQWRRLHLHYRAQSLR